MRTISAKFLIVAGLIVILFFGINAWRTWVSTHRHAEELTAKQAELALQFDLAISQYMGGKVGPIMEDRVDKDEFIPEVMSTPYAVRSVFEKVRREFPDYVIKFSSDSPRNPANAAGPEELQILQYFRDTPGATAWTGQVRMNGSDYLVRSIPRYVEKSCLHCHGRPEDAPPSLRAQYGSTAGFHCSPGDVIALDTVGVPIAKVNAAIDSEFQMQLAILVVGILALMGGLILAFRHLVGNRLAAISSYFEQVTAQPNLVSIRPIEVSGKDEISRLAKSFNCLAARLQTLHESLEQRVEERTVLLQAEIEERRRIEKRLELAQFCIDHAGDAVFLVDETARFVYGNDRVCSAFGYSHDELCNLGVDHLLPAFQQEAWLAEWERLRREKSFVIEAEFRTKAGDLIPVEVSLNHITFDGKEYNCAFARDITERRRTQQALIQSSIAAESANRAKGEFLANMSHEIRTPMTAILGYSDALLDTVSTPEIVESVEVIKRNANHLLSIINDILDLSKIEAGKLVVDSQICAPHQIVADVLGTMKVRVDAKGLKLDMDFHENVPQKIKTDPIRLRQILVNLVGNAIKFTELGSVQVKVQTLSVSGRNARLRIDVLDTGIGMSQSQIASLFRPFSQVDNSAHRCFGGTGLGLVISQRLAQLLGGEITVVSETGKGSVFSTTITVETVDAVESEQAADNAPSHKPAGTTNQQKLHGHILLAEDGPDNQRIISAMLRKAGILVACVDNGGLALDRVLNQKDTPFDLILMDMQMPVMDGYQATRELRRRGYQDPIIAVTAHAMTEDRQKCLDAGCDDYLTKPIERQLLIDTLAEYLKAHQKTPAGRPASSSSV